MEHLKVQQQDGYSQQTFHGKISNMDEKINLVHSDCFHHEYVSAIPAHGLKHKIKTEMKKPVSNEKDNIKAQITVCYINDGIVIFC